MFEKIRDLLIGVLFGLCCAGLILLVSRPNPGQAVLLRPPPTSHPLVVNIDGEVREPGVYTLPIHSRVRDVVEAAGGLTESASPGSVNLAALLEDGSHIYIPALITPEASGMWVGSSALGMSAEGELIPLVNINQAGLNELVALPGIGPVTAEKIINYREENLFTRIEDIQKVPGIGPATFEEIKAFLTIGE
jgi:competence protein ComEA